MKKKKRHEMILKLIEQFRISTQEELLNRLVEKGFDVTQATVSRDIRELKIVKTTDSDGSFIYSIGSTEPDELIEKFNSIFSQAVVSADYVGSMVVIRCYVGMAQAACASFDAMHWDGLVGTIAGDDTIFALCRTEGNASQLKDLVHRLLNS